MFKFLSKPASGAPPAPFNQLWLTLWATLLALGWLLPNHYLPWPNFHSDLWIAVFMALAAFAVIRSRGEVGAPWFGLFALALSVLPFLQYAFGLLPFAGQAWTASLYIAGFGLAIIIGARWERTAPGQASAALLMAIGAAATASVGVQLYQWLVAEHGTTIWLLPSSSSRPYANFAQPNQLGTFLLWGLVACAWGAHQRKLRPAIAVFMACYLLFGIALTQSRTAAVGVVAAVAISWLWRSLWGNRHVPLAVAGLGLFFLFCLGSINNINDALLLDISRDDLLYKTRNETRIAAYRIFVDSVLSSPWWGYGWNETARAQLAVAERHTGLDGFFFHAHNLFLDLLLWCGLPLGGLIVAVIVVWFMKRIMRVRDALSALVVLFIGFVGWHSMTELPLHYASFLLPTGLMAGVLCARTGAKRLNLHRGIAFLTMAAASTLLVLFARDYFEVEANFFALRFERAGLSERPPLGPPDVTVLTQHRHYINLMRNPPRRGMSPAEIQVVRELVKSYPSEATLYNILRALTLNGRLEEAKFWMAKLIKVTSDERYAHLQRVWLYEAGKEPALLALEWPNRATGKE